MLPGAILQGIKCKLVEAKDITQAAPPLKRSKTPERERKLPRVREPCEGQV
jgi:hypothetical protein